MIDAEGKNRGVLSLAVAIAEARDKNMQIKQVSKGAVTPVIVRMVDKQKERAKLANIEAKKAKSVKKKTIMLRSKIEPNDLGNKVKNACKLLYKGHSVQFEVRHGVAINDKVLLETVIAKCAAFGSPNNFDKTWTQSRLYLLPIPSKPVPGRLLPILK